MNRPGRTRTYNPRFWSALPTTPASKRLLIFKDLALSEQRRRRWTTPALALILALRTIGDQPRVPCPAARHRQLCVVRFRVPGPPTPTHIGVQPSDRLSSPE